MYWLDIIIDGDFKSDSSTRYARMTLFKLLQLFCRLQEDHAKEGLLDPTENAKNIAQAYLREETELLTYFSHHSNTSTQWMGDYASEKLLKLDNAIKKNTIKAYKKLLDVI